jgi:hypothetical protein
MFNLIALALSLVASSPAPKGAAPKAKCEVVGPRLDGTYVAVCSGKVTSVSDSLGNVHEAPFGY